MTYLIVPGHVESKIFQCRYPYFQSDDSLNGNGCSVLHNYNEIYGEVKRILQSDNVQLFIHFKQAVLHPRGSHEMKGLVTVVVHLTSFLDSSAVPVRRRRQNGE